MCIFVKSKSSKYNKKNLEKKLTTNLPTCFAFLAALVYHGDLANGSQSTLRNNFVEIIFHNVFKNIYTSSCTTGQRAPVFLKGDWLYNTPEMSHPVPLHYQIFLTEMML